MTAERGRISKRDEPVRLKRFSWTSAGRRLLGWAIAVLVITMVAFVCAALFAPRLTETLQPGSIQPDGDHAFMQGLSLAAPWPYVMPSHPDFGLSPGDTTLSEDGSPIGTLDPSHDEIRRLGDGRYDFWQGSLWFSTPKADPRDPTHRYTFSVKARLAPDVAAVRFWCAVALLMLIAIQIALSAAPYVIIGSEHPMRVVKGWSWGEPAFQRAAAFVGVAFVLAVMGLRRMRWRFRLPFLAVTIGLLVALGAIATRRAVPILYQPDSYGYIEPGLRLADGQSLAGTSIRDLGYPILTFLAVRLGSIANLVPLQFGMVLIAMTCMLLVMAAFFGALLHAGGFAPGRVPLLLTIGFSMTGVLYSLLLFSHDEFVVNIYSFMAETPHFLPEAVALLSFVGGWSTPSRRRRILLLALATDAAFAAAMFKPSSLVAFALCAVGLATACVLHRRQLRSPIVIAALVLTVGFVGSLRQLDSWATPRDNDFGAKILFCNHLDVIDGHLEPITTERAKIKEMIADVFSLGPHGWPEQGFDGDQCAFSQPFTNAIVAAARSEGLSPKDWQMHEFVSAILAHPLRYARHVARQFLHFARYPLDDADQRPIGSIADGDWKLLTTYGAFRDLPRERLTGTVPNWFADFTPDLVHHCKGVLKLMASSFALVAVASMMLALSEAFRLRSQMQLRAEAILFAVGAFTTALPLTVALSHSFDVGRYSVDILPFTVLWWCLGIVYILREALRATAVVLRNRAFRYIRGRGAF